MLSDFPRPQDDNGIGIHLVPHPYLRGTALAIWIDRVLGMKMKWVTLLNEEEEDIAYVESVGLMPVIRPFLRANEDWGDRGIVAQGKKRYIQAYNEPELLVEWPGSNVNKDAYIWRWIFAAENIVHHGGLPGIQLLDPNWLVDLLNAIKSVGKQYLFDLIWFSCHNYGSNHPPSYPYDALNPGKTIDQDWFAMLAPLKFDKIFREQIGHSVPIICTEGGWCIGDNADSRYPRVGYTEHRDFTVAMFNMFRTGKLPNGEPLPAAWFAVTPWLIASQLADGDMQFEENAWYSDNLSGTKTLTIEAVKAIPAFVRQLQGGTTPIEPEVKMPEFKWGFKSRHDEDPELVGEATSEQMDLIPGVFGFQMAEKGLMVYIAGSPAKFIPQALPKVPSQS